MLRKCNFGRFTKSRRDISPESLKHDGNHQLCIILSDKDTYIHVHTYIYTYIPGNWKNVFEKKQRCVCLYQ